MTALIEIANVRQPVGEPGRRWFGSDELELVVWCDAAGRPSGFQLCYDKGGAERALTWRAESGFSHQLVDDGDREGGKYKAIPILVADGSCPANRVADLFARASLELPAEIADFVSLKLRRHPDYIPPKT
jgi:hypothetical protein